MTQSPLWIFNLIDELNQRTFISDDELLLSAACPAAAPEQARHSVAESVPEPLKIDGLPDEPSFITELSEIIGKHWSGTKRELCEQALLLENTFYKIQSGSRLPSRDTLICLSLALGLSAGETRYLLGYLGYGLSEHIKRDYIILHCLELRKKPWEVNLVLEACQLRLFGPEQA